MDSVKHKGLDENTGNNVENVINGLEEIKVKLTKLIEKTSLDSSIIDEIRTIQCIVDETRKISDNNSDELTVRVNKVLSNVNQAISKITEFHENYKQSLPGSIFENLKGILQKCEKQLNDFKEKLEFVKKSIESLTEICSSKSTLNENSDKHTFERWAIALERFGEGLEDFLDMYPEFEINKIENFIKNILITTTLKTREENRKESYRRRLRYAANFVINLIESKKSYLLHEKVCEISEDQDTLVKELMILSESALNEIWLTPEEDEAWKDLLDT